jgi:hypothetical protein
MIHIRIQIHKFNLILYAIENGNKINLCFTCVEILCTARPDMYLPTTFDKHIRLSLYRCLEGYNGA